MPPDKEEKCKSCGGYKFSVNDGFKFCERCGALLENFEELEEEEGGMQQTLGQGKVKVKRTDDGTKGKKPVAPINLPVTQIMDEALEKRSSFLNQQTVRNEELPIPHDSTPDYLYRLALRLFSFTQVLAKAGHILVKELNFEPRVKETILATFQRYLVHCQVAFSHSEQCGDDEQLRFVAMMENIHYEEQERAEKRRRKLERRGKGAEALNKSAAAWTLLTQGNITENLDLASDSEDEGLEEPVAEEDALEKFVSETLKSLELTQNTSQNSTLNEEDETIAVNDTTMGFVRKVTTALSKEALRRAAQFILNTEVLVAILHSALMSAGYQNIFVSDVVRWIREDRFRISRKAIRLFRHSHPEHVKRGEGKPATLSFGEPFLRFPLYEIVRTCTIFNQSLQLQESMAPQNFETLAARLIDNLNLPIDFLSRVLLLESIVPCDVSPMLLKQVNVDLGYTCEQLAATPSDLLYAAFLSSFGRKERTSHENDMCDEVLLSAETKLVAYILLAFCLTFDLDNAPCAPHQEDHQFDIDTWIHQLEMRIKCWQGHDMSMVLRSSCPIPEMTLCAPFGNNYTCYNYKGVPLLQLRRRQAGFQKCIPSEMSFNTTSNLPTVFDVRHNRFQSERRQIEAVMAPLKFQRVILRKEMGQDPMTFETIDKQSETTFFKEFTSFKTTDRSDSFDDLFPFASRYAINRRPDWIQNCVARKFKNGTKTGPLRFYLSNQACQDLLGVATPSFSRRFQFLLESLSLLIGEDQKAVYTAFVMLEMHLTSSERLEALRDDLLMSAPILMKCQKFQNDTYHIPCEYNIMAEPTHDMENLYCFMQTRAKKDEEDISISEHLHLIDSRNHEVRDGLSPDDDNDKVKTRITKMCYNFETFFSILAVKFW